MKDKTNKVPIMMMIQNLVGEEYETVDFRNRIFNRIYEEVKQHGKEARIKAAFFKEDKKNDGTLDCHEMKRALISVINSVDHKSIEKFIKFLDKDSRNRISYTTFLNKMSDVSDRDHNPF